MPAKKGQRITIGDLREMIEKHVEQVGGKTEALTHAMVGRCPECGRIQTAIAKLRSPINYEVYQKLGEEIPALTSLWREWPVNPQS